jgi:hypothetical protein
MPLQATMAVLMLRSSLARFISAAAAAWSAGTETPEKQQQQQQ